MKEPDVASGKPEVGASLSEPPAVAGGLTQRISSSYDTEASDINIQPSATADGSDLHLSEPLAAAGGLMQTISCSLETEPSDIDIQPSATADGSDLPFEPIPLDQVFRRSVYDLERSENAYGCEIYVEEWEEDSARPLIWYEFTGQRVLVRYERQPAGIYTSCLGKTHYL